MTNNSIFRAFMSIIMMLTVLGGLFASVVVAAFISILADVSFIFSYITLVIVGWMITSVVRNMVLLQLQEEQKQDEDDEDE